MVNNKVSAPMFALLGFLLLANYPRSEACGGNKNTIDNIMGGTFRATDLPDGRTGNTIDELDQLTCEFEGFYPCQWGSDGPGTTPWLLATGEPDPDVWYSLTKTTVTPTGDYAYIGNPGSNADWLMSDPINCQIGDGYFSFDYWVANSASFKACAIKANSRTIITCTPDVTRANQLSPPSPGPGVLTIPGDINEPFRLAIIPKGSGFVAIDNINYDADEFMCLETTEAVTAEPGETTEETNTGGTGDGANCQNTVCDFDSGSDCAWVSLNPTNPSGTGSNTAWVVRDRPIGNSDSGVRDMPPATPLNDPNTHYIGVCFGGKGNNGVGGDIVDLESGPLSITQDRVITFLAYEATNDIVLKTCLNSRSNCKDATNPAVTLDDRRWKQYEMLVPAGTNKIIFEAYQAGVQYGCVGLDEIYLYVANANGQSSGTSSCPA
jgi:hypothetical protein